MPWMIASLADEIEEKADKMVQKSLQEDKIRQLNSHLADGSVQMEGKPFLGKAAYESTLYPEKRLFCFHIIKINF